jgi:hypothetical protein
MPTKTVQTRKRIRHFDENSANGLVVEPASAVFDENRLLLLFLSCSCRLPKVLANNTSNVAASSVAPSNERGAV